MEVVDIHQRFDKFNSNIYFKTEIAYQSRSLPSNYILLMLVSSI